MNRVLILVVTGLGSLCSGGWADSVRVERDPRIASDDAFPLRDTATYLAGEITLVEHVNRIGVLRLDRDGTINKYHWDLPHEFRLLPYGAVSYRGAPAELKDIPIGTHLHGSFYLGPEGWYEVEPPVSGYVAGKMTRPDMRSVVSAFSRVLTLEDDFSFYQRQGAGWKIVEVAEDRSQIVVERLTREDGHPDDAEGDAIGMTGRQVFRLDSGCRVWRGASVATTDDLAVEQVIQVNLGWVGLLGPQGQDALCREIWIDAESRRVASDVQRGIHRAHQRRRGIAAKVIETESIPGEGARGWVTVEVHAGIDPELVEEVAAASSVAVWAVEPTLRGYDNDSKPGSRLEVSRIGNPEPGSAGVRIRMHFFEMIEGFRPGRTVRIAPGDWPVLPRPREEKLWQKDIRIFSVGPRPVADRDGPPASEPRVGEEEE